MRRVWGERVESARLRVEEGGGAHSRQATKAAVARGRLCRISKEKKKRARGKGARARGRRGGARLYTSAFDRSTGTGTGSRRRRRHRHQRTAGTRRQGTRRQGNHLGTDVRPAAGCAQGRSGRRPRRTGPAGLAMSSVTRRPHGTRRLSAAAPPSPALGGGGGGTIVAEDFVGGVDLRHLVLRLDQVLAAVLVRVPFLRELAVGWKRRTGGAVPDAIALIGSVALSAPTHHRVHDRAPVPRLMSALLAVRCTPSTL